jgi:hypothetical protein
MVGKLSKLLVLAIVAVGVFAVFAPSAFALFSNGGFEDGTFGGWTKAQYYNPGLLGSPPFSGADITRFPGGTDLTQIEGPFTPMSQSDANTGGALQYPLSGQYCAVINLEGWDTNANTLSQDSTVAAGDVDPGDGKVHINFAWAAVVQNPAHPAQDQPYVYISLRDLTKDTTLYETFIFAGDGSIWQDAPGSIQFTDWQVLDIPCDSSALAVGDQVEIQATASGCAGGAHWGYLYVDSFGSFFPVTPHVTVADKFYDGTTDATITGRSLTGVATGADVGLSGGSAAFSSADPGTGKSVNVTGLSLTGADAAKYTLTSFSAATTANIYSAPTVTTTAPSGVTSNAATGGGSVSSDGGSTVTERGVCWSTSANPTTADSHTTDGSGTGSFTSIISGLKGGTTYHVRAYATVSADCTAYGDELTFTTLPSIPPTTTVRGVYAGWSRHSENLSFVATAAPNCAPVAYIEYRVANGAWTHGAKVTVGRQGRTTIQYRSVDTDGNVEVTRSCSVRVDSIAPRVTDYGHPVSWTGGKARFSFKIEDAGAGSVVARLAVSRYHQPIRQFEIGSVATGRHQSVRVACGLSVGTWCWRVVVRDLAGTRGVGSWHYLEVYPGRSHNRQ